MGGELKSGHYATLFQWMRDKVHRKASAILPQELMTSVTGKPTGAGRAQPDERQRALRGRTLSR